MLLSFDRTILAAEVGHRHILQWDLSEKSRTLAARIPCDDVSTPEPNTEPGQTTVAVEGIGQQVPVGTEDWIVSGGKAGGGTGRCVCLCVCA